MEKAIPSTAKHAQRTSRHVGRLIVQLPKSEHSVFSLDTANDQSWKQRRYLSKKCSKRLIQAFKVFIHGEKDHSLFYGIDINTEWRSDWKWDGSKSYHTTQRRKVLDVGCGSGYHCWRMYGSGASFVLGLDPSLLFWMQFRACKKLIQSSHSNPLPVFYAPIPMDAFPINTQYFDTVFSMGVLYHRRDPFSHLERLKQALKKGGELVLETLIMDGPLHHCFVPEDRYAQMRNVWCIPSVPYT